MLPPNLSSLLLISMGIYFASRFVLLSITLWAMLRAQDLNYNIPGMLASAALASVCDMVPIMGHPMAVAVLLLCVLKLTGAHLVDVRFTVAVSYAVMFFLQMMILTLLPSNLPVHARTSEDSAVYKDNFISGRDSESVTGKPKTSTTPHTQTKTPVKTNAASAAMVATNASPTKAVAAKPATDYAKKWKLKGVVGSGKLATAMIGVAGKTYTIGYGEKLKVETGNGAVEVSLEASTQNSVVLNAGGSMFTLSLQ